jgi:hypothetical protein
LERLAVSACKNVGTKKGIEDKEEDIKQLHIQINIDVMFH